MRDLLRQFPILWLLIPLIALIIYAEHAGWLYDDIPSSTDGHYRVVIQDYALARRRTWRYEVETLPERTHAYIYLQKDSSRLLPSIGDTLLIHTTFREGQMLGSFDYGRYLRLNGIAGTAYVRSRNWQTIGKCSSLPFHLKPKQWQHNLYQHYRNAGLQGYELATTAALTLGYKEDLDPELKSQFQKAGAAHILAVSGLHTGILYGILFFLFTLGGLYPPLYNARWHQRIVSTLIVSALIAYAALTGGSPSVVRSVIFVALVELATIWHRQPFSLNTLFVTAFLILVFRPLDLFSVSFQLSFAAVAGILILDPLLRQIFPLPSKLRGRNKRIVAAIRDMLTVSIAAQVFTMPLSLHYFGQTSNFFFMTNLLVIPLAYLLMCGGLLVQTLGWIPALAVPLGKPVDLIACLMNTSVGWVEHLPYSVSYAYLSLPQMAAMYLLIIVFTLLLKHILR